MGASDYEGNKFELTLQFPNDQNKNNDTNTFLENLKSFETSVKEHILKNAKDILGKSVKNMDGLEMCFVPMLKYPKNKETGDTDYTRDPTLRVKFYQMKGQYQCNIYDEDSNPLWLRDESQSYEETNTPMSYFKKGMMVATAIECGGIWSVSGRCGISWRLVQAIVKSPPNSVFSS